MPFFPSFRRAWRVPLLPLSLLAVGAPVLAGPAEGSAAWERGDYTQAVAEWRPAAIQGDPAAQYGLGQAYLYGRGVAVDLEQARLWFEKAAAQGHAEAQDNLGLLLFQEGERQKALPYLERSAARGEPRAQYVLGTAKFNGDLVDKDWVGAYALMTRASAAGLPQASRALAQMDKNMPLALRQQGQVLARNMESAPMAVAVAPPPMVSAPPPQQPSPSVASIPVPPSKSATSAVRPDAKTPPAAQPVARGGAWRVQLGAFSSRGAAQSRWDDVRRAVPALADSQPFYQAAGALTRIQAGSYRSRSEADAACRAVKATGRACFAVRP